MWTVVFERNEGTVTGVSSRGTVEVFNACSHQAATAQTWLNKALAEFNATKYSSRRGIYVVAPIPMVMP